MGGYPDPPAIPRRTPRMRSASSRDSACPEDGRASVPGLPTRSTSRYPGSKGRTTLPCRPARIPRDTPSDSRSIRCLSFVASSSRWGRARQLCSIVQVEALTPSGAARTPPPTRPTGGAGARRCRSMFRPRGHGRSLAPFSHRPGTARGSRTDHSAGARLPYHPPGG